MELKGKKVGIALTGSHCTLEEALREIEKIKALGAEITPIISEPIDRTDTRFGEAEYWKKRLQEISGKELINSIVLAEPIGPQQLFDCLVIVPCTGNTLAKLANGIIDSPVLMAAKAHLRNLQPLVLAISTNDGLGLNAKNIGILLNTKHIYLVPFRQDNPCQKPNSLVSRLELLIPTIICALEGKQYQPILASNEDVKP
ncbi:MAG: dipicolinate synthase subunit B [Dethiobacteria bacterium]|jgi:dipicolinate synthase subunit B|nr:dipicolinate synthase subunit B [Bacillota bacterium]